MARRIITGKVVSNKMDKTIVVSVESRNPHHRYGKIIRMTTKFKAHDEKNDAQEGDMVKIEESRPLSKDKRWSLLEVIERAQ